MKNPLLMRWSLLCITTLAALTGIAHAQAPAKRPNVVVILSDDVGWGDLGCYGATKIKTPNLDALAKDGMRFTDAHASAAVCTPTRYSLLTGEYSWRKNTPGLNKGVSDADATILIPVGSVTLPSLLKTAGYHTGVIGKWHLGFGTVMPVDYNKELTPGPLEVGFDEYFGYPSTNDRVPTVYVRNHRVENLDPADPIKYTYDAKVAAAQGMASYLAGHERIGFMSGGKAAVWQDETMADTLTREVVSYIERNKANPFFLYFAAHDVHPPNLPNPRFHNTTGLGKRADMVSELDWSVGEILKALDRLGLVQDTLLIFSSDNGAGPTNEEGHHPNGPWRGKKSQLWEGGHRVPFMARWPGHIPAGSTSDDLLCLVDVMATSAAAAGVKLPVGSAPDSFNLLPTLLGQSKQAARDSVVVMSGMGDLAIRQGQWKFIPDLYLADGWQATFKKPNQPARPALFDLADDQGENRNRYKDHPEIAKRMAEILAKAQSAKSTRPPSL